MSSDRAAVEAEFAAIPQVAPKPDELPDGADTRNRYANVIPLPETRVVLSCRDGDPLSQYINANYVRGPKSADKFYIACQAPLASTVHDFWRMVWETQAKVILMLTDLVEDGVVSTAPTGAHQFRCPMWMSRTLKERRRSRRFPIDLRCSVRILEIYSGLRV